MILLLYVRIESVFLIKSLCIVVCDEGDKVACKLFPQRIEDLFINCETVEKCAVVVKPDKRRRFVPIAFVTLNTDNKDSALSELHHIAVQEMPDHMQPADIVSIDTMPMTQSGKIDYKKLEEIASGMKK